MLRFIFLFTLSICLCSVSLLGQQLPANIDFSTVNVDNLSDDQLQQLLTKAQQNGLTVDDVVSQAQAKGLPQDQADKLRSRLTLLNTGTSSSTTGGTNTKSDNANFPRKYTGTSLSQADSLAAVKQLARDEYLHRIYGSELFSNSNLTFEPNLNIPTPGNYVIGPGDNLVINVYGYSEANTHVKVSPEGFINVQNVGPIQVSGLTIDAAKDLLLRKLTSIYSGIKNGSTHVQLLLGDIRSIQVMLIGQVTRPGSYTLPSLATVANALYVSGGPDINGSFRDIEVIRDGKSVVTFDLYDFLLNGSLSKNILLKDQDIIKVNPYQIRVELRGEVKRPAIFEAKQGETLGQLIGYAGGFTSNAYNGFIRANRVNGRGKEMLTLPGDSVNEYTLRSGDVFYVDSISNRYSNRVVIKGAVFHEGPFALDKDMSVRDLIQQAGGLKDEAYMKRGLIKRLKEDYTPEILDFNVADEMSGKTVTPLHREDSVILYSKPDIHERYYIVVHGEVNRTDTIPYADGIKLGDVILLSGGLKDDASLKEVEVGRRVNTASYSPGDTLLAVVRRFNLNNDLSGDSDAATFTLQPFDQVFIRHSPGYHEQAIVEADGQVIYPGAYVLDATNERISDLIRKAGGLKKEAFAEGALLLRQPILEGSGGDFEKNKLDVFRNANMSNDSTEVSKLGLDSTVKLVNVNLDKALRNPGSKYDVLLQKGDVLRVPKVLQTVSLYGEVFYPKLVRFDKRYRFKDFVSQGGGFTARALRRRSYVVYANGEVASTTKVLFFNKFPKVKPGSEIFVPAKRETSRFTTGDAIGLTTGLATVLAVLIAVLK